MPGVYKRGSVQNNKISITQKTFLYYVSVLAFSFLILRINWMLTFPKIAEAVLILTVILFFVTRKSVQEYLSKVPSVHLRFFLVFLFLLSSAHFIEKEKTTYPFLTWGMYSGSFGKPQIDFYDYQGVAANSQTVRIIPENVFPVLKHSRFNEKLRFLLEIYRSPEQSMPEQPQTKPQGLKKISHLVSSLFEVKTFSQAEAAATIDVLVLALGREYNDQHKTNPLVAIEISLHQRDLGLEPHIGFKKEIIRRVVIAGE